MLVKSVSRKQFLDVLQAHGAFQRVDLHSTKHVGPSPLNSDEIQLVWSEEDAERGNGGRLSINLPTLPRIVVVGSENKKEFLAWVWTYLPEFRPLTAYTRVLDFQELTPLLESMPAPQLGVFEEACLGLILGEAATYVESKQDRKLTITPLSCAGTCSYAMARTLALAPQLDLEGDDQSIAGRWLRLRTLTRQQPLKLKPEQLALPWKVLMAIYNDEHGYRSSTRDLPDGIYRVCSSIFRDSEPNSILWGQLLGEYPRLRDAKREMAGPREGRVQFFEQFLSSLSIDRVPDVSFGGFLCGFLASQIGPGTLDYLPLLIPRLDQFPTALLWYGLCSGLQRRSSLYGFGGGLGRRVLREIVRRENVFDSPEADIALSELEMLTVGDAASMDFRTAAQGILAVEILPMVVTTVRWQSKPLDQSDLFSVENSYLELRELSAMLDDLRQRIVQIQNRMARIGDERDADLKSGRRQRR